MEKKFINKSLKELNDENIKLNEENEQLKEDVAYWEKVANFNYERSIELLKEKRELKQKLINEQLRTIPITLTTHISDEDFKKFEELLKKHYDDIE